LDPQADAASLAAWDAASGLPGRYPERRPSSSSRSRIVGGILVARRGLGAVRTLLLANVVMQVVTIIFPIRSEILPLAIGFFLYLVLVPVAEASEQTTVQKVVSFQEQGRVFGFAQTVETAASPVTAFLIGPIVQFWVIPSMADGELADRIGSWFGTGSDRGMALIFIIAGVIGLLVTLLALRSRPYRTLSSRYAAARSEPVVEVNVDATAA
jgi:DHA3 family multidrug efflux protein-like MFS transporter